MPDFHLHAVNVPAPGAIEGQDTLVLANSLRDVVELNQDQHNFRIFGPDETLSNLLGSVFDVTNRQWDAQEIKNGEFLAPAGRAVDSMLSEHQCEGWLEGYLLTGRHGLFNFGFHGYPTLIHRLTYRRTNQNLHVRAVPGLAYVSVAVEPAIWERQNSSTQMVLGGSSIFRTGLAKSKKPR